MGRLFCRVWAHRWAFLFTNDYGRAVFGCQRCRKVEADRRAS